MMVELTYQMLLSTLQTVGLLVGISYYLLTLRNQNRARQATLFMQLYNRFTDPNFCDRAQTAWAYEWDGLDEFRSEYRSDQELRMSFNLIMNLFEGFGVLLKKGLIDGDLLYEQIPTNAYVMWDKFEPWILWVRENVGFPQFAKPWEFLAGEMRKIALSRGEPDNMQYKMIRK
jgi:hypothetical protein